MKHVLLAISGPSGVGKGTIVKNLLKKRKDVALSVSCTTRAPRENERDKVDYYFISKDEFLKKRAAGEFLESDEHFGNFYGTPKSFVEEQLKEKNVILEIDVVGALNAKKIFPSAVLIFIMPPSEEVLIERLKKRNSESEAEIENRVERLNFELQKRSEYDYVVVNDDVERATLEIEKIIDTEKEKN